MNRSDINLTDVHERAALVLGWPVPETKQFSLQMLRELVRHADPKLADEITTLVASGQHIFGERP